MAEKTIDVVQGHHHDLYDYLFSTPARKDAKEVGLDDLRDPDFTEGMESCEYIDTLR